jgi:hypothetical protein
MKILTANFLTCAVKACKTSASAFPLHFKDAELVQQEMDFHPAFVRSVLARVDWGGLRVTAGEVGVSFLFDLGWGRGAVCGERGLTELVVGLYDAAGGEAGG